MTNFDINDINDPAVWDLISTGKTKGIFQLESNLGKHWAKEIAPRNISDLAALISLLRPGVLKAYTDGKSMTQHYADRRKGTEPIDYPDDSLEPILKETYGVLVYQEQSMRIAKELAGFNLQEADNLRKAIGKKKADLMEKVKKSFLEGAASKGIVTKEIAEEIFSWIEKSNRYAFNKSHAVCYALNGYWGAYCKHYRIVKFYTAKMKRSDRKPKPEIELKQLIMDAKNHGIETYPPRLGHLYTDFVYRRTNIYFGLRHVKNVGTKECEKIEQLKSKHDVENFTWINCLVELIHRGKLNKRAVTSLISVGAFTGKNNTVSRQQMLYEYDSWNCLSAREKDAIADNYQKDYSLEQCVQMLPNWVKINSRRIKTVHDIELSLNNPMYDLHDSADSIADAESKLLGCALTCSKADSANISTNLCKDIVDASIRGKVVLSVVLNEVKTYVTKRGKNPGQEMAFLSAEDSSGELDSITVFPEAYRNYKDLLIEGNTVLLSGEVSKRDKNAIIVNKVRQI